MKKMYYAWLGERFTTIGRPNPVTGLRSLYGELYAFDDKSDRDAFCDTFSHSRNLYPIAVTKKQARRYHFGVSVEDYNEIEMPLARERGNCWRADHGR